MTNYNPAFTPEERRKVIDRAAGSHPLEMFPWFRRWPQGHARDLAYTFIWNLGFAAVFTVIGVMANGRLPTTRSLWIIFVVSNCVGYSLHLLFFLGGCSVEERIRRAGRVVVTLYYMGISTAGVIAGFWLSSLLLGRSFMPQMGQPRSSASSAEPPTSSTRPSPPTRARSRRRSSRTSSSTRSRTRRASSFAGCGR